MPRRASHLYSVRFSLRDKSMKRTVILLFAVLLLVERSFAAHVEIVEIRPELVDKDGVVAIECRSGATLAGRSTESAPAGVDLLLPGAKAAPVQFRTKTEHERIVELRPVRVGTLTLCWHVAQTELLHLRVGYI